MPRVEQEGIAHVGAIDVVSREIVPHDHDAEAHAGCHGEPERAGYGDVLRLLTEGERALGDRLDQLATIEVHHVGVVEQASRQGVPGTVDNLQRDPSEPDGSRPCEGAFELVVIAAHHHHHHVAHHRRRLRHVKRPDRDRQRVPPLIDPHIYAPAGHGRSMDRGR